MEPPANTGDDKISGYFYSSYVVYEPSYPFPIAGAEENQQTAAVDLLYSERVPIADAVLINSKVMPLNSFYPVHILNSLDDPMLDMRDSCVWQVIDTTNSERPSIRYSDKVPFPSILGKLPDTVSRQGFKLNIKASGADSVFVSINGDTANHADYINRTFLAVNDNYFFTADDLKTIISSDRTLGKKKLRIIISKGSIVQLGSRRYYFERSYIVHKRVWLKT